MRNRTFDKTLKRAAVWTIALAAAFAAFAMVGPDALADKHSKVAEERSRLMKGMGGAMRTLKGFVEGRNSAEEAAAAVMALSATAAKIADVFPPGTGMGADPKSEAKDEIWEQWDEFEAAAALLGTKAAAFGDVLASSGDVGAAFGELGKDGCGGCHRQFREKRN